MTTLADEITARLQQEVARTENMMEQVWGQYQNLDYLEGRIRAQRDLAEAILETGDLQNGTRYRIDDLEQAIVILYRQLCTVKEAQAERERKREQARKMKQEELQQARDAQILRERAQNGTEEA